jgi:hypothetical protein
MPWVQGLVAAVRPGAPWDGRRRPCRILSVRRHDSLPIFGPGEAAPRGPKSGQSRPGRFRPVGVRRGLRPSDRDAAGSPGRILPPMPSPADGHLSRIDGEAPYGADSRSPGRCGVERSGPPRPRHVLATWSDCAADAGARARRIATWYRKARGHPPTARPSEGVNEEAGRPSVGGSPDAEAPAAVAPGIGRHPGRSRARSSCPAYEACEPAGVGRSGWKARWV